MTTTKSEREAAEEAFEQGFHGIPDPKKRATMSPEKLAILLSQQEVGSPAHILVEHELNLRIAGIQSRATLRSGWLGVFGALSGALLGAALGFFLGTLSPKENSAPPAQVCRCECNQQGKGKGPVSAPKPTAFSPVVQGRKPLKVQPSTNNAQQP